MSGDDRNKTVFRPSPLRGKGGGAGSGSNPPGGPGQDGGEPASGGFSSTDDWDSPAPAGAPPPPPPASGGSFKPLSDDPFSGPAPQARQAGPAVDTHSEEFHDTVPPPSQPRDDRNPMMAHAAPVLAMAAALQSGRWQISIGEFHRRAREAIGKFESAIQPIYSEGVRQRAKYAVCATIDDIAQNLPGVGGGGAQWAQRNMVVTFFRESIGGDRFWDFVQEMLRDPASNRDLIELFHACLAAGFEGRTRAMSDGYSKKQQVMASLIAALEHVRSLSHRDLVSHWKGADAPRKPNNFWAMVGLAAAAAGALCFLIFLMFFLALMASGSSPYDRVAGLLQEEPVSLTRNATQLALPPSETETRLREFLSSEISQGLVTVEGNRVRTTIGTLFEPASDQLTAGREPIFTKIGQAIELEKGPVTVEGHADSDQISTIEFPDNMALSTARAETVARIVRAQLSDASRVTVTGLGDTVPLASNDTAEGKAQNRRVEFVVELGD
ncbi:type IVB secretion system protein IcmH/DotU [Erythrobacter sp. JK5]|uniref:type IVB secretion system protein IcmH/DotU n=1 Tax=Erythrobacter sp. JK5 TaxID=2829500 RepID=UPI001BAB3A37|nr:type IVB secretion system protein IcmH/DotU [Erythrobacter sp. JK5]QUL36785.1 type IVB secretion system protein IcmH/DotU [Erythrobacter sp. JK5]